MPIAAKTTPPRASSSSADLAEQELGYIAFNHLLDQHPRRLSVADVAREIGDSDQSALERAVTNLVDAGLLARHGEELVLSPVALRVDRRRAPSAVAPR